MQITCGKCHRPLKDPKSIKRGFGPDCWASIQEEEKEHKKPLDTADESDFNYHIAQGKVLVINDLNQGGRSVTNNMKAIIKKIATDTGINPTTIPIIYRDSDGNYDGVKVEENGQATFYPLVISKHVTSEYEAVEAARKAAHVSGKSKN